MNAPLQQSIVKVSETCAYPAPPWRTSGDCCLVFYLADAEAMRPFIPFPLELVTPLVGRTLAGYYCGCYNLDLNGQPNPWHEFGLVAGWVRYGRRKGFYISQMLTDSPAAWRGGIDLWGLDKTLAGFKQEQRGGSTVLEVNALARMKAVLRWRPIMPGLPMARDFSFFTFVKGRLHHFTVRYEGRASFGLSRLKMPVNEISFPKPVAKIGTTLLKCSSITINGPEDIDLRGYHPKPDKDVRVPD